VPELTHLPDDESSGEPPGVPEDDGRVAITGLAGRFPGAGDVDAFWQLLVEGREGIAELSEADLLASGVDAGALADPGYVRAKGVLGGADLFDAGFFGFSPREAEVMDPQHRVLLECAWHALESASVDPHAIDGRIGVFAGASMNSYLLFNLMANPRVLASTGSYQTLLGSDKDFLATRVSYKLGLTGPSLTVQTACSTSLTAVHLACQSLLSHECDVALAGGVSVSSPLRAGYAHEAGGILSPDGHCRSFDADGAGTVAGNGVGLVVLRRLADARSARDRVVAVIRGTAVNNDGAAKAGYTAPSVDGQAAVIAEALAVADVDAGTVGYVEAHGTATALGDPIEVTALTRVFREQTDEVGFCALGSVKSNVGHLDAAAGVTALIKASLALRHEVIPASLHFRGPNPALGLPGSPFVVPTEPRPWPRTDVPRRAGVSAFGIGGTNVHVVLEEAPAEPAPPSERAGDGAETVAEPQAPVHLLTLSARTPAALDDAARRLADHLQQRPELDLADVGHTLARRVAFEARRAVACRDTADAVTALRRSASPPAPGFAPATRVAYLFPGQGAQYVGMAAGLHAAEPDFAVELDRCAELLVPELGQDLRELLFAAPAHAEVAAEQLRRTAVTQPVLFAVEYALARWWWARGVRPAVMAGHSIGEYVAACLAGVFGLEDAVRLVAARGRLVDAMPTGAMLAVNLPEPRLTTRLGVDLCVSAVNSSRLCTVSGPTAAIAALEAELATEAVACRRLHTSHGFHSPSMDAAIAPLVELVRQVRLSPPSIPFFSNVTGSWITDDQATDPQYWGDHLRAQVRFADALGQLLADPGAALVEVGPGQALRSFAREHDDWTPAHVAVGSLRHPREQREDQEYLVSGVGALWEAGLAVERGSLTGARGGRLVDLPGYPFQRQRYWVEPQAVPGRPVTPLAPGSAPADGTLPAVDGGRPAPQALAGPDGWFFTPGWRRLAAVAGPGRPVLRPDATWIVLGAELPMGRALAKQLEGAGARVVQVGAGAQLHRDGELSWRADLAARGQLAHLLDAVVADEEPATLRIVHAGTLGAGRYGFDALLALGQALGDAKVSADPERGVTVDVLARGIFAVTGTEALDPEQALLLGPVTVLPQELSGVRCRLLELPGADPSVAGAAGGEPGEPDGDEVDALLGALTLPADEPELAWRGRHWWVREVDPVKVGSVQVGSAPGTGPTPVPTALRDGGVYLLTGGLGGIALALADWIADAVDRPVLGLLSRSGLPPQAQWDAWIAGHGATDPTAARIGRIRRLSDRGARVVVLTADVTDLDAVRREVDRLREHGPLNGVVHAAGLPSTSLITGTTTADAERVLAAKTRGTLVLEQVCRPHELDFLVLCSSLTAVLGGPGQIAYCAANAFLDAYAQQQRARAVPVTSIGWDTWRGVGMAAGLAAQLGAPVPATPEPAAPGEQVLAHQVTTLDTAHSWIVDEHRIQGHGLVPGTTYLELVRQAVAPQAAGRPIELREVLFLQPLIVPDGQARQLHTVITAPSGTDDELRFAVRSPGAAPDGRPTWHEHACGSLLILDGSASQPHRDLDEVRGRAGVTEVIESEADLKRRLRLDEVERGTQLTFTFGPRWRALRRIESGPDRILVTLRLDEAHTGDLAEHPLHPALLDLAGAAARIHARDTYYLPFSYRRVRILADLTPTVLCDVRPVRTDDSSGETYTCDFDLLDPSGRVLVQVDSFSIKRINDLDQLAGQLELLADAANQAVVPDAPTGVLGLLAEGISQDDGIAAFARLLAAPDRPEHVLVAHRDLAGLRALARSITPDLLIEEVARHGSPSGSHPRPDLPTPFRAPGTDDEDRVAAIWQEVLGIDRIGLDDDFFALGGHSLAAVQIGAKLRQRFGVVLDLSDFFDAPTVAHTVTALHTAAAAGEHGGTTPDDPIPVLSRAPDPVGADDGEPLDLDALSDHEVEARLRELLGAAAGPGEQLQADQ
jgi:acyl transferase domain-containing protein/acyl carrier protein